jgi:SAM-dependent methyltransferase
MKRLRRLTGLRGLTPISRVFGLDRGKAIDRFYIESFLAEHAQRIHGCALEVGDSTYTRRFGGERVTRSDVLHAEAGHEGTTIQADLTHADQFPPDTYDCIILTQTLQHIYDLEAAVRSLHHALRVGGSVLVTLPGISQISRYDADRWGDLWRFTEQSARRLFETAFVPEKIVVASYGNVYAAASFLYGLAAEELSSEELAHADRDYPVTVSVVATKARHDG